MSVFGVAKYIVKADRIGENIALIPKFKKWMKQRPELFGTMKSYEVYSQQIGGSFGGFLEIFEYEDLGEFQKSFGAVMQDKEYLTKWWTEMVALMVPGSFSIEVWDRVP